MLSVSLDDISVTFEADPGLVGAKRAPYLCLKLGSGKTVSQTTACAKGSRFGVAWEQIITFQNVKEGAQQLEVQLLDHHTLQRDKVLGTASNIFVTTASLSRTYLRLTDRNQKYVGKVCFRGNLQTVEAAGSSSLPGVKVWRAGQGPVSTKLGFGSELSPIACDTLKRQAFLDTNWKIQYASLACQVVLKAPISVAVISSHIDTAEVARQLASWADTAKVKLHAIPCQQSASLTQKGKDKKLSVKKFIDDKELAGGNYDAWMYVMGPKAELAEPGSKDKVACQELKHDRALLKGLLKRTRLPLTIIHTRPTLQPAACKKALQITKDSNAAVFCLPPEEKAAQIAPGQPMNPLGCYLHPWASSMAAAKATVPCLHARVATHMLVRREVDRQLARHRNPRARTVLWVGISHTGLGILVPIQPFVGIPLLIAESFTRMFYHVLHVCHTAGIIYNLKEAWATLKGAITKRELASLKRNPKLTKTALQDAAVDGGKAGLEGAAEAIFVELGVIVSKKLASIGAKQVMEQACAAVASQVAGYVLPAIGALLTVAMLPHTYHKIHQMVTCMAYTYHENWAFTSSLPLPMVYQALCMTQPDLAAHLSKAQQLEEDESSGEDLITTQWQTAPQYNTPLACHVPSTPDFPMAVASFSKAAAITAAVPMERYASNTSSGAASIHPKDAGTMSGDNEPNEPIDFDTLFCYKRQEVSEQQLESLERGGSTTELMQAMHTQPVELINASDGTQVATWPFSSAAHNAAASGGQALSFSEVIGEPPPPEDAFHPEAWVPWCNDATGACNYPMNGSYDYSMPPQYKSQAPSNMHGSCDYTIPPQYQPQAPSMDASAMSGYSAPPPYQPQAPSMVDPSHHMSSESGYSSSRSSQDAMLPQSDSQALMYNPTYQASSAMAGSAKGVSMGPNGGPTPFGPYAPLPEPTSWGGPAAGGLPYHQDSASSSGTAWSASSPEGQSAGLYGSALSPQPSPLASSTPSQNMGSYNDPTSSSISSQNLGSSNGAGAPYDPATLGPVNWPPASVDHACSGSANYSQNLGSYNVPAASIDPAQHGSAKWAPASREYSRSGSDYSKTSLVKAANPSLDPGSAGFPYMHQQPSYGTACLGAGYSQPGSGCSGNQAAYGQADHMHLAASWPGTTMDPHTPQQARTAPWEPGRNCHHKLRMQEPATLQHAFGAGDICPTPSYAPLESVQPSHDSLGYPAQHNKASLGLSMQSWSSGCSMPVQGDADPFNSAAAKFSNLSFVDSAVGAPDVPLAYPSFGASGWSGH